VEGVAVVTDALVTELVEAPLGAWQGQSPRPDLQAVVERGGVVVLPRLPFAVDDAERGLFDASLADAQRKSIYVRAGREGITGTTAAGEAQAALGRLIARYARSAHALVDGLFPGYRAEAHATGTSFRPRAIGDVASGKALSWRKDDTRMHVDAFPSNPTHGARILRVFTNVHPAAMPRAWRVGERFEDMARRFLPKARALPPGASWLMNKVGITKRPRSAYDQLMLQLHDLSKADLDYQRTSPQRAVDFMPGTTWICFSDQVMHAAMSGQFLFEQTYRLPLAVIDDVEASPLRILERLTGRTLL
jgi:3-deoxy-D-manno-oct-2-ulosonic acid (Kdo) hydroxylase